MKKKQKSDNDVLAMMTKIQGQLAVLDQKLDSFMTKSLNELAQARASSKVYVRSQAPAPSPAPVRNDFSARRPMYSIVCYACGKDAELPFRPSGNRPVYCKECFAKRKSRPVSAGSARPSLPVTLQQKSLVASSTVEVKKKAVPAKPSKAPKKASAKKTAPKKSAKKTVKKKTAAKKKTTAPKKATKKKAAEKKTATKKRK